MAAGAIFVTAEKSRIIKSNSSLPTMARAFRKVRSKRFSIRYIALNPTARGKAAVPVWDWQSSKPALKPAAAKSQPKIANRAVLPLRFNFKQYKSLSLIFNFIIS